ncbi:MAG: SPASM domain-containing protein, partial [Ktedonobacteraceae bacterium]|nr:SPASM domain-containing protein [Ktedonobacteraceae bacterium]
ADGQMIDGMLRAFAVIEQRLPRRRLIDSLIDKASMRGTHQHTCGVGRTYMVIDQRGQVAKCHADIKQAVTTIDADDPLQIIRNDRSGVQAIPVEEKQGCRSCEWRHWCTGGCPLLTYRMTGRNDIRSPNCNIYKALFPEALRLEALRLLKYEAPMIWS